MSLMSWFETEAQKYLPSVSELEASSLSDVAGGFAEGLLPGALAGAGYAGVKHLLGGGKKHRRMNPLNGRAARRAIRRIAASMHMLHSIERMLPKHHTRKYHFPKAHRFGHRRRRA